jgi:hypothetical protein
MRVSVCVDFLLFLHCCVDHRERRNLSKKKNGHTYTKSTHASRSYAARTARQYGADSSDTQALGHWKGGRDSTVYKECYDNVLPMNAMLANAMFSGTRHDLYDLPRDKLGAYFFLLNSNRKSNYCSQNLHQNSYHRFFHG